MKDLAARLKKKDKQAIAWLYDRYGKKLYGYAVSKWQVSEDDAWDLVYKTLYKIMDVGDTYTFADENRFTGFVFKVFSNYLRNHYRDRKNKTIATTELNDNHAKHHDAETDEEPEKQSPLMQCLQKVLQALEDWQRIVLLMRAQDFPYEHIATYVNKPPSQLKVYHLRLKKTVTDKTNECVKTGNNENA